VKRNENYGLYITQNTYQMKWYCFHRDAADNYWNGKHKGVTAESEGANAESEGANEALSNYKNGVYCQDRA